MTTSKSRYVADIEDENNKLREQLEREQLRSDDFKRYYDLIRCGKITDIYEEDNTEYWRFPRKRGYSGPTRVVNLVIKYSVSEKYDLIQKKYDEYLCNRQKIISTKEAAEAKQAQLWRYAIIAAITTCACSVVYFGCWAIWWAFVNIP